MLRLLKKVKIKFRIKPIPFIFFQITDKCNYRCEYCIQDKQVTENASDEVLDALIDIIHNLKGTWKFMIMGGEALVHPRFFELAKIISKHNHNLFLITNFSFPIETYKKLIDIYGNKLVKLNASLHLSQVKSIDDFIEKAAEFNRLKPRKTDFSVTSVISDENFEILQEIKLKLKKHNIKMNLQRCRTESEYVKYDNEIEKYLDKNPENSAKITDNLDDANPYGITCAAGYKSYRILKNGDVHRCATEQPDLFLLGNITDKTFKPFNKPMPCLAEKCTCCNTVIANHMIEYDLSSNFGRNMFKTVFNYAKRKLILFLNKGV